MGDGGERNGYVLIPRSFVTFRQHKIYEEIMQYIPLDTNDDIYSIIKNVFTHLTFNSYFPNQQHD